MNCENLFERLGFQCRQLRNGDISVSTSFTFVDGEPIGFYLQESGEHITITDHADTLAHAAAVGFDISDRKKWKGFRQIVSPLGLEMLDSGQIVGRTVKGQEHALFARYVTAMLSVVDLEREYLGTDERLDQYIKEVEFYLAAWKPKSQVVRYASAEGHSGRIHRFDFEQDETLIDAAKPHQGRTGSILRKATDINNTGKEQKMLVVMDDRDDPERAEVETDILSTLIGVLPFSRLVAGQHNVTFVANITIGPRRPKS